MKTTIRFFSVFKAGENSLVFVKLPFLDRDIDADNILPDDTTRADV
jgi:hypothetical protein